MTGIMNQEILRTIRGKSQYIHVIDKETRVFHRKDCPLLDGMCIRENRLIPARYSPGKSYRPCEVCKPDRHRPGNDGGRPPSQGERLCEQARRYGMEAELKGSNLYIRTLLDEWFFDFKETPVMLHHKNADKRVDGRGACLPGDFHRQEYSFDSPVLALTYIRNHTDAVIRYRLMPRTARLRLEAAAEDPPKLFCESAELMAGDLVKVLLPEGWQEIRLGKENETWKIATPGFESYSPVGLFARIDSLSRRSRTSSRGIT